MTMEYKQIIAPQPLFWPGSLNVRGFSSLLDSVLSGGYRNMAISPLMINQVLTSGRSITEVLTEARSYGVTLSHLDGVSSWAPLWHQEDPMPWIKERFDFSPEQCLDMAEALGMTSILAVGAFDRGALPVEVLIQTFGEFCDEAAKRKMRVELEFIPFWGIPDLTFAWDIVSGANRPNSGLLIDTWHLQKGTKDLEGDIKLLASIPQGIIQNVQLADASIAPQADSIYGEGRFRQFPGDGELAIDRILKAVYEAGALQWVGTEIFGEAIDKLTSVEAGKRSASSTKLAIGRLIMT